MILAHELLLFVPANPHIHGPLGIYAAYRRMYEAMGIQQIEQMLPPHPQPQPVPHGIENSKFLQMQPAQAFQEQNHESHMDAHITLFKTALVSSAPPGLQQVLAMVHAHI